MQNILILVKNLTSGGAEKQSIILAKGLSCKYIVHYVIFNNTHIHKNYLSQLENDSNIHIEKLNGGYFHKIKYARKYICDNKIDCIFSYLTQANFIACVLSIHSNVKVFIGLRNSKLPFHKLLCDKMLCNKFAEKVICNSFSGKSNFVKNGFNESKIKVIQNGIENLSSIIMNKEYCKTIHVVTVGRFVKQKDYETAIKSIRLVKEHIGNIEFDIIGYGKLEQKIHKWLNKYEIDDITNVLINPNNISSYLQKADIYLSTSIFEGTSNSIMEAMNANLPIIATNVGDNIHLVKEGKNGFLCNPKDEVQIANRIIELVSNKEKRVAMGLQSKEILTKCFSVELMLSKYISLIEQYD